MIRGKPVYAVTDVTLIPLASQGEASKAIAQANKAAKNSKGTGGTDLQSDEHSDNDEDKSSVMSEDEGADESPTTPEAPIESSEKAGIMQKGSSVIADVIKDKGKYGRFAEKWFSKGGWNATVGRNQGMSSEDDLTREQKRQGIEALPADSKADEATAVTEDIKPTQTTLEETIEGKKEEQKEESKSSATQHQSVLESLTPRILRSTKLFFASRNFYFSYDYDLSRSLSRQGSSSSSVPLFKRFDELVSVCEKRLPC